MNTEIKTIISTLHDVLSGQPWYGRAVYEMLEEADIAKVYIKPNNNSHSLIDLTYHMVTWAEFTQKRIEKEPIKDMAAFEALDWRIIDPAVHTWQKSLVALKASHDAIIKQLRLKDDSFLEEPVDYREYNFRYLLHGLVQHNIYHIGQIAYVTKMLNA